MEGTKNSDIRVNNRKRVINTLFREGAMTKQELATELNLSLPTVTMFLKELMEKGLIEKGEALESTGGRKPVQLKPAFDYRYAVGVEVTKYEVRAVLIDLGNHIQAEAIYPHGMEDTPEYWKGVNRFLNGFMESNIKEKEKLCGVGLTMPLMMNQYGSVWKKDVPREKQIILPEVEKYFDVPLLIRNSAKMAAIAQLWSRSKQLDFVFVSLGTYVGGALVYNSLVMGFPQLNSRFQDMVTTGSGQRKRISDICSMAAMCERAGVERIAQLFEGIDRGDVKMAGIWEECLDTLARLFYNLHCILGWRVVIGGGLCPYLKRYQEELFRRIDELEEYDIPASTYVEISDLGIYGASIGAAMMMIDWFLDGIRRNVD